MWNNTFLQLVILFLIHSSTEVRKKKSFEWKCVPTVLTQTFQWTHCTFEQRTPSQVAQQLRQRVKQVLKCDVRLENPFHPVTVEPADCIVTSLCLEAACKDLETYRCSLRNIASLLRPGGLLVMVGVLGETYYVVGGQRFSCLDLSQATIEGILKELGFSVTEFNVRSAPNPENNTVADNSAVFHLMRSEEHTSELQSR